MLPRAVDFVLVFLLFSSIDASSPSYNNLIQRFNKEAHKLILLLRSHAQPRSILDGDQKEDEKRIFNIGQAIKDRLQKLEALRKCKESLERKCQRLQSCFYQCMRMRAGASFCKGSCQKAFDPENECGTADEDPSLTEEDVEKNKRRSNFFRGESLETSDNRGNKK